MDFPATTPILPVIASASQYALGQIAWSIGGVAGSAVWPSANRGIFVPFAIPGPYVVRSMFCVNGTAVDGNIDLGILSLDGALIVSTGSTTQTGTSTLQVVAVTATPLAAGRYYMALSASSTSAQFLRAATGVAGQQAGGIVQAASQVPLTNLPTFATPASAYVPWLGLASITNY